MYFQWEELHYEKIKEYIKTYGNNYFCYSLNRNLNKIFKEECEKYGLLYKMNDIVKAYKKEIKQEEQLTFI